MSHSGKDIIGHDGITCPTLSLNWVSPVSLQTWPITYNTTKMSTRTHICRSPRINFVSIKHWDSVPFVVLLRDQFYSEIGISDVRYQWCLSYSTLHWTCTAGRGRCRIVPFVFRCHTLANTKIVIHNRWVSNRHTLIGKPANVMWDGKN